MTNKTAQKLQIYLGNLTIQPPFSVSRLSRNAERPNQWTDFVEGLSFIVPLAKGDDDRNPEWRHSVKLLIFHTPFSSNNTALSLGALLLEH